MGRVKPATARFAVANWWSGDSRVDGILSSWKWDTAAIRYSDPDSRADYGSGYRSDLDSDGASAHTDGFARLTSTQLLAVGRALDAAGPGASTARAGFAVEGFTDLAVSYAGTGSGAADIRLGNTRDVATAYAWSPGAGVGGDVWFGGAGKTPVAGSYDHMTVLHEVGHALGLKHAHSVDAAVGGRQAVPASHDSPEFTVMTYRGYSGGSVGYRFEKWGAPQSFMMLDIRALQQLYGADFSTNSGSTTYSWKPDSGVTWVNGSAGITPGANRIFATIWDGGGSDSYDLSAYRTGVTVDLRPGAASVFSSAQLADLGGGGNDGHARGNIFNALQYNGDKRSLIEKAVGGSGADKLTGNAGENRLLGNDGDDTLCGEEGRDSLYGGRGADVFVFDDGDSRAGSCDRLFAVDGAAAFQGIGASGGDRISLRPIDADTGRSGDQAFVFGTSEGRGRLWADEADAVTYLRGNTDGDSALEFELAIHDGSVSASDYSAGDFLL